MTQVIKESPSLDTCDFVVCADPVDPNVLGYYERMRAYIEHEDGLINSRLTWSLTIHGFLFATYGLLLGKAAEMLMQVYSRNAPATPSVLEYGSSVLFLFQIPVAMIGGLVSHYSREAIVAAHNSIQHLYTIGHASGILRFSASAASAVAAIPPGSQTVTVNSLAGIAVGARLMVSDPRHPAADTKRRDAEIVSVTAVGVNTFSATFVRDHPPGAQFILLGPTLLPKLIAGGSPSVYTEAASDYYLRLPRWMEGVWIVLSGASALMCVSSFLTACQCTSKLRLDLLSFSMNHLTAFGLFAVTAMLITYGLEKKSPWFILAFAVSCILGSTYGFLQAAWPFGVVEAIWSAVAVRRWWLGRTAKPTGP